MTLNRTVAAAVLSERIKVALTLFADERTNAPTKYLLERIYVGEGDRPLVGDAQHGFTLSRTQ